MQPIGALSACGRFAGSRGVVILLGFLFAVLAACSNATSNVLQRMANREEPEERSLSLTLIWDLIRRKDWLAGFSATVASFVLQGAALRFGALAAVQPIIVLELPLTLIGSSLVLGAVLHRREWTSIVMMTAGVAGLVAFLQPKAVGHVSVSPLVWALALGLSMAVIAGLVLAGVTLKGAAKAAVFGAATGLQFGVTAALMKAVTERLSGGIVALLTGWQTYAMIASGIAGMYLMQNALHAGRLVAGQPGITLLDPVASILWGILVFGEQVAEGPLLVLAAAGAGLMAAGAFVLSRSELLSQDQGSEEAPSEPERHGPAASG